MSNLQLIERLCGVIEVFCDVVRMLLSRLEQVNALDEECRKAADGAYAKYSEAIGSDEPSF